MCAEQPQPHRYNGNSQPLGNLLRRIAQHVAQQARTSQIGREPHDGIGEEPAHFAAGVALFRIVFASGDSAAERLLIRTPALFQGNHLAVAPLPKKIDRAVRSNARNPGAEIAGRFFFLAGELFQSRPRLQQGLLAHIFRVRGIAREPARPLIQGRHVGRHHFRERFGVPAARLRQQPRSGTALGSTDFRIESPCRCAHVAGQKGRPSATPRNLCI